MDTSNKEQVVKKKQKPLKRHPALVPLSKDHHFGLLLCWKIRTGIRKEIAEERIAAYVDYFFQNHLLVHFDEEEKYIFSLLDEKDEKRKKAEKQHRKIGRLIERLASEPEKCKITLGLIEEEVESHIRYEERDLFPYIQTAIDETKLEQLRKTIEEIHEATNEIWEDKFWEK